MTRQRPEARFVRPGEMLAMDPGNIRNGPQGMFWLFGGGAMPSEMVGSVAVVHVRNALDHHADSWDDNYESIVQRVRDAASGEVAAQSYRRAQQRHEWENGHKADYQPLPEVEATPPSKIAMCVDSPGGVVAGLNECVFALQKISADSGIEIVTFVNEMAASAAFALACGSRRIFCPPSAVVGSIGVISTMISQAAKNKHDGYDVRLITSGARKADGHLHGPIEDAAVAAERGRVDKLAASFFKIASKARGVSVAAIEGLQAGIFLGADAERKGLVDEVIGLDDLLLALQPDDGSREAAAQGQALPKRAAMSAPSRLTASKSLDSAAVAGPPLGRGTKSTKRATGDVAMSMKLTALIARTSARIVTEKDPKKLASLAARLDAYKKTEKHIEHTKSEEGDDEDGEDPDKPEDGEDDEEAKAAAAKEKAESEEKAAAAKAEEDAKAESEDEKKASASAIVSIVEARTGRKGTAALGAIMAQFAQLDTLGKSVASLQAKSDASERASLVAKAGRYFAPHALTAIKAMPLAALTAFVETACKGEPMVYTSEGELAKPKATAANSEQGLPAATLAIIDQAVANCGLRDSKAFRKTLVEAHIEAHNEALKAANGGSDRY